MKPGRVWYRSRQFWNALQARPAPEALSQASAYLTPALQQVFERMSAAEKAHSLAVLNRLLHQGETHPDLLAAALLHDVGKSIAPLRLWERVVIVLGRALFSPQVERWGRQAEPGASGAKEPWLSRVLKRPFRVASRHPEWGARLVEQAGGSPGCVRLVRRHQDLLNHPPHTEEDRLLAALQAADDEN
jgi:hypothetical protein